MNPEFLLQKADGDNEVLAYVHLLIACTVLVFNANGALAEFNALTCAPYKHGDIKKNVPTFFCAKREDAEAYIDLMRKRRLNQISDKQAHRTLLDFRSTRECFHVATTHMSTRTLHQGEGSASYCNAIDLKATKWPSLIEAVLTGDKSKIWILTHAIVPPAAE